MAEQIQGVYIKKQLPVSSKVTGKRKKYKTAMDDDRQQNKSGLDYHQEEKQIFDALKMKEEEEQYMEQIKKMEEEVLERNYRMQQNTIKNKTNVEEKNELFRRKVKFIADMYGEKFSNKIIMNTLNQCQGDELEAIAQLSQISEKGKSKEDKTSNNIKSQQNTIYLPSDDNSFEYSQMKSNSNSSKNSTPSKQSLPSKSDLDESQLATLKSIFPNIKDELIVEAFDINQNNMQETAHYLSDDNNIKSLIYSIEEHEQDLKTIDNKLESILENLVEEDSQKETDFIDNFLQNGQYNQSREEEEELPEVTSFFETFIQKLTPEMRHNPEIQLQLKKSRMIMQQMELFKKITEENEYLDKDDLRYRLKFFKEKEEQEKRSKKKRIVFIQKESEFPQISMNSSPCSYHSNIINQVSSNANIDYGNSYDEWNKSISPYQSSKISNVGNEYLQVLCSRFPHVDYYDVMTIFQSLNENYDSASRFLLNEYGQSPVTQKVTIISNELIISAILRSSYLLLGNSPKKIEEEEDNSMDEDQELREQKKYFQSKYGKKTFQELREDIILLHKVNQASKFAEKSKDSSAKINLAKCLQNFNGMSLSAAKEYSKVLFLIDCRSQKPMDRIDLHGFFKEEALEILKDQILYLKNLARQNKTENLTIRSKLISLEIITGQGLHSQNQAVLKPLVIQFLTRAQYQFKAESGKVNAKISY